MWVTEDTYDKEYVATHTIGMDKIEAYVLGKEGRRTQDSEVGI